MQDKLQAIVDKHIELGERLGNPADIPTQEFAAISKEYSDLTDLVEVITEYREVIESIPDLEIMAADDSDKDMQELAQAELQEAKDSLLDLEHKIQVMLLPKDAADAKNAILEVRAGTGGDEAALFAADLFQMYQRYADKRGWKFEIISVSDTGIGGYKEAQASIAGNNVFERLKFESGVHRVQRVPATETQGRVHTSAATVAVLPEAEEVDVELNTVDLKIDVYRASGPGGQSVNTTDSAVRITHLPTGIVVQQQDEKSQHKNKAKAMKILLARIYDYEREQVEKEHNAERKNQIGSGDRSERIRTYNYPQSRVTDHRINLTLYKIDEIVNQGDMDEVIDALISEDTAAKLSAATAV